MFFECRHLSHTHSAYTSAVNNWKAASVKPVQPLKQKILVRGAMDDFNKSNFWDF